MTTERKKGILMKKSVYVAFRKVGRYFSKKGLDRLPGAQRVYEIIDAHLRPGIILIERYGSKMYVNAKDTGMVPFLLAGSYEEYGTKLFLDSIKPGMVIVDVGANFGYYSLIAAGALRGLGDGGQVYAFEPEPGNYELLLKNIEINGYTNITPSQSAVSASTGRASLYLDSRNLAGHSLSSECIIHGDDSVQIETSTLDDFFMHRVGKTKVDILKIDTQGAEGLVLEGAWGILDGNRAKIFMEFWTRGLENNGAVPVALLRTVVDHGYSINIIDEESRSVVRADAEEVIERCEQSSSDIVFENLLLEKPI